jgi:amino acid transporter
VTADNLTPVFDRGIASPIVAGALVFVAFEGFQLIANTVRETRSPKINIPRGIYGSIAITTVLYIAISVVALGGLGASGLIAAEEYALSVAAQPSLGTVGTVLVDIAAMLATASAINATLFGASRMVAEMASEERVPAAFSHRNRTHVPWVAMAVITAAGVIFTMIGSLEMIAVFSSLVFLIVSLSVAISNWLLRERTRSSRVIIGTSILLMLSAVALLVRHLAINEPGTLFIVAGLFVIVSAAEYGFSKYHYSRRDKPSR